MRKASKKTLKKKCDDLWRNTIRSRGRCERCGRTNLIFNAHHIIGRINHSTTWDLRNGINLCEDCHEYQLDHPKDFTDWFGIKRPYDYNYLLIKKLETIKLNIEFYQETLKRLETEFEKQH